MARYPKEQRSRDGGIQPVGAYFINFMTLEFQL
jgi:hypothetical protein